ncbi:artemin-like [Hyaena hyaena]|uniref:artemin-like n=1 Tax=Hyaena hyaena TaxID=95912 RepID=UPI0019211C13|nr:artemin-like [Hyaena hyaena]
MPAASVRRTRRSPVPKQPLARSGPSTCGGTPAPALPSGQLCTSPRPAPLSYQPSAPPPAAAHAALARNMRTERSGRAWLEARPSPKQPLPLGKMDYWLHTWKLHFFR